MTSLRNRWRRRDQEPQDENPLYRMGDFPIIDPATLEGTLPFTVVNSADELQKAAQAGGAEWGSGAHDTHTVTDGHLPILKDHGWVQSKILQVKRRRNNAERLSVSMEAHVKTVGQTADSAKQRLETKKADVVKRIGEIEQDALETGGLTTLTTLRGGGMGRVALALNRWFYRMVALVLLGVEVFFAYGSLEYLDNSSEVTWAIAISMVFVPALALLNGGHLLRRGERWLAKVLLALGGIGAVAAAVGQFSLRKMMLLAKAEDSADLGLEGIGDVAAVTISLIAVLLPFVIGALEYHFTDPVDGEYRALIRELAKIDKQIASFTDKITEADNTLAGLENSKPSLDEAMRLAEEQVKVIAEDRRQAYKESILQHAGNPELTSSVAEGNRLEEEQLIHTAKADTPPQPPALTIIDPEGNYADSAAESSTATRQPGWDRTTGEPGTGTDGE